MDHCWQGLFRNYLYGAAVGVAAAVAILGTRVARAADPPAAATSEESRRVFDGAVALHKAGTFDLAVDEWEKFVKQFPNDPLAGQAQFFAGVCYLSLKDKQYDKARDAFEKVVAKYPKFEQLDKAYFNLGLADYNLAQAGRADLNGPAAEAFGQVVAKFPNSPQAAEALLYRGESLYAIGKKEEAIKSWRELTDKFAGNAARIRGLYNLGIAQQELGRQAAAATAFEKFLVDYGDNELAPEVNVRKLDAWMELGRFADAEKQFATLAAKPNFALADYATLREAAALAGEKKYAEAAAVYASLPANFPKSTFIGAATAGAGNCYYLAGNQSEARNWYGKTLAAGGDAAPDAAHWIARSWLKDKNPGEALAVVDKVLPQAEKSPRRGDLLMDRADALYDIPGRRKEAADAYAKLSQVKNSQGAQARYMAASASLSAGDYPAALEHAAVFAKAFPQHELAPEVKFIAAEALLLSGKHAEAVAAYKELLKEYPHHADAEQWFVRGALARYLQKQYSDVVAIVKPQVAKLKQPDRKAEALFLLGSSQLELKQFGDAAQSLAASIAVQPKSATGDETLFALASAQRGAGDANGAKETLKRLFADYADSKLADRAHFRLAEWSFDSGAFDAAASEYQWLVDHAAQSPLAPRALVGLGWSQISKSDFAGAAKSFSAALEKYAGQPVAIRALYGRATARQQLKEYAGAVEDAEAFLKADPKSADRSDVRYILGLAEEGLKKNPEAARAFESLLADDPRYAGADKVLYELAWVRKSSGQEDAAADAFGRLAREHGDSPLAAESWFNVGEYQYHRRKDYKAAVTAYSSAVAKAGKSELGEKAAHKLGWAWFQAQEYQQAEKAFGAELRDYPSGALSSDAHFMAGESLFKQSKYETALAVLQNAAGEKLSSTDFTALALLHAAQSAAQLQKWQLSLKLLAQLQHDFPKSPQMVQAAYDEAWAKQNLNLLGDALKLYESVADKTDAVVGARARFMMGEVLFTQGNHKEAVRNFLKVVYGYGDTQSPPAYKVWQANATYEAARCFRR